MNAIFGFFANIIGWVLTALYSVIDNYGISIIVLTLLIRLAMVPLYAKQMKSSAKMSDVQGKIKDIQTKLGMSLIGFSNRLYDTCTQKSKVNL